MSTHSLITTPFGFDSTAAEVGAGVDLNGKRAIITGGSSDIGVASYALDPTNAERLWELSLGTLS
jgi:hypothetical protein